MKEQFSITDDFHPWIMCNDTELPEIDKDSPASMEILEIILKIDGNTYCLIHTYIIPPLLSYGFKVLL